MVRSWGWLTQLPLEAATARVLLKDLYGFDLPDDITTSLVCVFMNWDHQDLEDLVIDANQPNFRTVLAPRQGSIPEKCSLPTRSGIMSFH
jgi:hypothetical protein